MADAREIALLPCPFCGSINLAISDELDEDGNWVVWCTDCKGGSMFCEHKAEAIAHWNTRQPIEAALLAERERCAKIAEAFLIPLQYRVDPLKIAAAIREGSDARVR